MRLPPPLVALSPGTLGPADVARALLACERALAAGLPGLSWREPALPERAFLDAARALRAACDRHGAWLCVHDRLHAALAVRADGVQLSFRSLDVDAARAALAAAAETASDPGAPGAPALGASVHAFDEPFPAADYLVFGPVRATPKPVPLEPVGFTGLAQAVLRAGTIPLHAIGGLEPDDVAGVLASGARGLFVRRGVLGAADPAAAVRAYGAALGRERAP